MNFFFQNSSLAVGLKDKRRNLLLVSYEKFSAPQLPLFLKNSIEL